VKDVALMLWTVGVTIFSIWEVAKGLSSGRIWASSKINIWGEWLSRAENPEKFWLLLIFFGATACLGCAYVGNSIASGNISLTG
jgi:hypothetical protein